MLDLTYAPRAIDDVRELMQLEQSCCAFLEFNLRHDDAGAYLRVAAPESARLAANELFAHFTAVAAAPAMFDRVPHTALQRVMPDQLVSFTTRT